MDGTHGKVNGQAPFWGPFVDQPWQDTLSNEKRALGWLFDIGDEMLPSYTRGLFHKS